MKKFIYIIVILSTLALVLMALAKLLGLRLSGDYVSPTIKDADSKEILQEIYKPITNPYKINDTLSINVKEAWLENDCHYNGKSGNVTVLDEGYKLLITLVDSPKHMADASWWLVTKDNRRFYGENGVSLVQDYDEQTGDTIKCKVINSSNDSLGQFILIRTRQLMRL